MENALTSVEPVVAEPALVVARPIAPAQVLAAPVRGPTDSLAIASAVCGLAAPIPIVAQVAGLILGYAGLRRISKARSRGENPGGKGWALTGIIASGFVLIGWIASFAILAAVSTTITSTMGQLDGLMQSVPQVGS